MLLLESTLRWLLGPTHWIGPDGIPERALQHLAISGTALLIAAIVALPAGVLLGHTGRGGFLVVSIANIGRALPSLAVLALILPLAFRLNLGLGFWPTVIALVPLGIPLILINSYAAVRAVDRDLTEVARGMGMHDWEVLWEVELPVAAPIIVAGVRNAAVTIVATATLGALVASGGLGRYIVDGLARQEYERLIVGAVLVAVVSVLTELAFARLERIVVPRAVRAALEPSLRTAPAGAR